MIRKKNAVLDFIVFAGPAFLIVLLATLIPFFLNLYYSLFNWNGVSRKMAFIGFDNFIKLFSLDKQFAYDAFFTARLAVLYVLAVNVIGILLALALSKTQFVSNVARSCFYITNIISLVAIGFIWKFIFGPGIDALLAMTNFEIFRWSWLGTPRLAFYAVLFVMIWQNAGFYMIIYIAGLIAISKEIKEAARIDGSYGFGYFFRVILPLLMPSVTICVFHSLMYAFKLFDTVLVFTSGGPGASTQTVAFNIYYEAFKSFNYGYATAKSVVFFIAVLCITVVQLGFFKNREVES